MRSSLRSRLALLLVLANLPAAALAIGATVKGRDAVTNQRKETIVQRAELIATRAGLTLGVAEGVADALAANRAVASAGPACAENLKATLSFRPEYTGILVSDTDGEIVCAFGEIDVSQESQSALMRAIRNTKDAGDIVFLPEQIPVTDTAVLISRAFTAPDGKRRAIGLLLRRNVFDSIFMPTQPEANGISALALIRNNGVIVSEFIRGEDEWRPAESLPIGQAGAGMNFQTRAGVSYYYAVAPVRGTLAGVVLATPMSIIAATDWIRFILAIGAPLLMLLLGILDVFVGVDRLVLRWIGRFRQVTAAYARGTYTPRIEKLELAPTELAELGLSVNDMAARVQERSAALEEAVQGKNLLLRELHHRVKNNFQMIASLLALQRRELPSRLRMLLRVPEDRVLAMAAAYKASYATGEIGLVSAHDLLRDIAGQLRQSFGIAAPVIRIEENGERQIWLDLDQAVPLGLLVSEILTAALDRPEAASLPVTIQTLRAGPATLQIELGSEKIADCVPSMGLAARLVAAYRAQINATISNPGDDLVVIAMPLESQDQPHPGRVELGA